MADMNTARLSLLTAPSKFVAGLDDTAPVLEVWHDGSDVAGVQTTAATFAIATDVMTLTINGAVDTRIGSSGTLTMTGATLDTITEVAAAINKVSGWYCRVLGALVGDTTNAVILDVTAVTCYKTAVKCYFDTSAAKFHTYNISNCEGAAVSCSPGTTLANKINAIYYEKEAANCLFYLKVNPTLGGGTETFVFYSVNGATETESVIGTIDYTTSTTAETYDFTECPITALSGERLVIRLADSTSLAITESLCIGKSIKT